MSSHNPQELLAQSQEMLLNGVQRRDHPFRYGYLATAADSSSPQLRTVVLRKFQQDIIYLYTDYRSPKVAQLIANPKASLLFFDPQLQFQIRITAQTTIHYENQRADEKWSTLNDKQRQDYQSIHGPGTTQISFENVIDKTLNYFCLLEFRINKYDILSLSRSGHMRAQFAKNEQTLKWEGTWINP